MQLDNTTFNDLSIFHHEEEFSIFSKLDFTQTMQGRDWLYKLFQNPFSDSRQIQETQQILKTILNKVEKWPKSISNGTVMVIEKFYESNIDSMPGGSNIVNALSYKLFHTADFSLVRYSLDHFADFFRGLKQLSDLFDSDSAPVLVRSFLHRARELMSRPIIRELVERDPAKPFSLGDTIHFGNYIKDHFKNATLELINIYSIEFQLGSVSSLKFT